MSKNVIGKYMRGYWPFYVMIIPAFIEIIIFSYIPLYGIQIAFKDFSVKAGIWGSQWVGLKHFQSFISLRAFYQLIRNTFLLSFYSLIFGFPIPIILAFMINELKNGFFKRSVQLLTYAPYFISTVAVVGLINLFMQRETGLINALIIAMGGQGQTFLTDPSWFRTIYVVSGIWQGAGWGTIIYLATLSTLNPEIKEAGIIDGASRLKLILYIYLPAIIPTIIIVLILNAGFMFSVGFEKVYLMQNDLILDVSDVISTYIYRLGILNSQYSYTTAIGLFNSIINALLLIVVNSIAKRFGETSLW